MWMVLTVVYIREIISYASFSPEDGEEANEIYNVFGLKKNDKLQCVYSGRTYTLSWAGGARGVCLAFWDMPGGLVQALSRNALGFSGIKTVGAREGLDPTASWLLSSARLKPLRGLSLGECCELPALIVSVQHSPAWPVIGLLVIWLQTWIWKDWNGEERVLDVFRCNGACVVLKKLVQFLLQTSHFYL